MRSAFELHNASAGVSQACIDASGSRSWLCNTAQGVYPHISAPVFLLNSVYDAWSTACILGASAVAATTSSNGNCSTFPAWQQCLGESSDINNHPSISVLLLSPNNCSGAQIRTLNSVWREGFLDAIQRSPTFTRPGNGAFLHTCHIHCSGLFDETPDSYHLIRIGNVSIQQAIRQWWAADPKQPAAGNTFLPCTWHDSEGSPQCNPTCDPY